MARTSVPTPAVPKGASTLQATGVAVDAANGHVVVAPASSGHTLLDIDSTFAGAKTFTIKKGVHPGSELGDLVVSLNAQRALVLVPSDRFMQQDGTVNVDVQAGATGTVRAYHIPY